MRRPGMVARSGAGCMAVPCSAAASSGKRRAGANPLCRDAAAISHAFPAGGIVDMRRASPKLAYPPTPGGPMRLALPSLALIPAFAAAATAAAQTLEQVKVGTTNVASDVGFFIAEQKGYFRDAGIAVTTTTFASAAKMIAPLGTGELDVGGGTVAAGLYNAVGRGIDIKVVADKASVAEGYEYSTLLVRKDLADSGRYKSLADLKGMTIATAAQGAGS